MRIVKRVIRIFSYILCLCSLFMLVLCFFHNDNLKVSSFTYKNPNKMGANFKICLISDFHHREYEFPNADLVKTIVDSNPNIVVFVGDMIDDHVKSLDPVKKLMNGLVNYPIYYVTGNHEEYASKFNELLDEIRNHYPNIHYIDDCGPISLSDTIDLYGIHDPRFDTHSYNSFKKDYGNLKQTLDKFKPHMDKNKINILLAHRPEISDLYAQYGFDVVLSGHSHGGQICFGDTSVFSLIFHGFSHGEYHVDNTTIYVSRGLGYSAFLPIRVNSNPEIVNITIQ